MSRTFAVKVLGCKVNQYEAEQIRDLLRKRGLTEAGPDVPPDIAVLHSCAVTAEAVRKTRHALKRMQTADTVFLTGCSAAAGLIEQAPSIHFIAPGSGWIERLEQALDGVIMAPGAQISGAPSVSAGSNGMAANLQTALKKNLGDHRPIESLSNRHRAFIKIQDGCDIGCSYCIVPSLRGPSRDKPLDLICSEAAGLVRAGYRELVITGVSVGLYGKNGGPGLAAVLRALLNQSEPGRPQRIRMSSLHPAELTDELLEVWASNARMMPHVHLPLQAGSANVLAAMQRGYTPTDFLNAIDRLKSALPQPAFTTDIIVGFPGESAEDFEQTLTVCREVGFSRMHIFPYSVRPGTEAERLGKAVPRSEIKDRIRRLKAVGRGLETDFARKLKGSTESVLVEKIDTATGKGYGYTERYLSAALSVEKSDEGEIVPVEVGDFENGNRLICRKSRP